MLPNFFIVGAPKAGTTSFYFYLDKRPVFMSPVKEPNYFSFNETIAQNLYYKERGIGDLKNYEKLFSGVRQEKAIGEASVSYLFYPSVPALIKEKVPGARIIIMLRNPVDRALSHYYMDEKLLYVKKPFAEILKEQNRSERDRLHYQQYIELGFYYEQVKRYLDTFGNKQVKIFLHDDLLKEPDGIITELYDFLEIDKSYLPDTNKKYNTYESPRNGLVKFLYQNRGVRNLIKRIIPEGSINAIKKVLFTKQPKTVAPETVEYMRSLFKPDIQKLELLLNRNLKHWYE